MGIAVSVSTEPIFVVALVFVLVVPFEKFFPRHPGKRVRRPQVGTDIAHAVLTPLLGPVTIAAAILVGIASLAWIPGLMLRPLVSLIPPAILPFAGIALFDFTIYWVHRWNHEVPFLWRFHAIHHSTEDLDWISGFRNHPLEAAIIAPPFILLLAAGFDAEFTGILAVVQIVTGLFLHANVRWRWRPLHRVVITPEFHHWHHTNDPQAINTNYSVFLPLWDMIFGTYFMPKNRRPEKYGVNEFIPKGVVAQLAYPLRGMGNPLRVVRHPIRSFKGGVGFTRLLLKDIWKSTRRQTHRAPVPFVAPHSAGDGYKAPGAEGSVDSEIALTSHE